MLKKIKELVSTEELKKLDRVIEEIYSIDDGSNHSVAFQLGFDTVANHNGSGYANLVIIVNSINDGGEDEDFARFILSKGGLPGDKIEALALELLKNETNYKSILWPE